jgi:hypothetical protein
MFMLITFYMLLKNLMIHFFNIIKDFICDSMNYKLSENSVN